MKKAQTPNSTKQANRQPSSRSTNRNSDILEHRANKVGRLFCLMVLIVTADLAALNISAAPLDMNGDGKTDYVVVRNTGGGSGGQVTWFVQPNGGAVNSHTATPWGISTDFFISGDFDGDGKHDIAVWRSISGGSYFYVLRSSNGTLQSAQFGTLGDDPTVVGDYDGDGKADYAVYRGGAQPGQVSAWYYRPSTQPNADFTTVFWGRNGDFPAPGDYDGDGKMDFAVQRNNGSGQGVFLINKSNGGTEATVWGASSDLILPGDYDGDGKTDFCVGRGIGGQINWFILERDGGTQSYTFGRSATDFPVQGDYTGDGKTDIAVWRPSANFAENYFFIRPAQTTGAADFQFEWGLQGDYPVANFNSH